MLDLSHIELATEEDKEWNLTSGQSCLKRRLGREIKMLAKDNEYFTEASNTLCDLYANFNVRERCRDREDYELEQKYLHDTIAKQENMLTQKDDMLITGEELEEMKGRIQELTKTLADKCSCLSVK